MANGARFSQIGADLSTASDQEMHFDSGWPTMHTLKFGNKTGTGLVNGSVLYAHGLGYVPAFLGYSYDSVTRRYSLGSSVPLAVDNKNIYYLEGGGSNPQARTINMGIIVFNINIEQNYTAVTKNPSATVQGGDEPAYGMKFTRDGATIISDDMQDYKVNTNGRAPLIHAVAFGQGQTLTGQGTLRDFTYTHDLPYNPMFLAFVEYQDSFAPHGRYVPLNNTAGLKVSGKDIIVRGIQNGYNASIIVLKDPFDASDNVTQVAI